MKRNFPTGPLAENSALVFRALYGHSHDENKRAEAHAPPTYSTPAKWGTRRKRFCVAFLCRAPPVTVNAALNVRCTGAKPGLATTVASAVIDAEAADAHHVARSPRRTRRFG